MENFAKTMTMLANPDGLEKAFLTFLAASNIKVEISKSFGGIVCQHSLLATGEKALDFFTGELIVTDTNLEQFIRLQGEYFVITDMRFYEGINAVVSASAWTPGVSIGEVMNGNSSIRNNGISTLPRIPLSVHTKAVENPFSGFYNLPFYQIWGGQQKLTVHLDFPAVLATANLNIRCELWGLGLVS